MCSMSKKPRFLPFLARLNCYCLAPGANRRTDTRLLANQRNLEIGWAILLRIKAAAVDIARAPEQQIASEIDEVVFHEICPLLETKGSEGLPEYALGRIHGPRG